MSKLRSKCIGILAVLFCTLLLLSAALFIPKTKTADAYSSQQSATVSQIWTGSQKAFDNSKMQDLYSAIVNAIPIQNESTANDDSTFDAVKRRATVDGTPISSAEIQVQFGGFTWTAVYLSKAEHNHNGAVENVTVGETDAEKALKGYANDGDVVLTLWLSYSTINTQWSYSANSSSLYPANMYGTSYIRSYVLANGGQYWNGSSLVPCNTYGNYGFADYTTTSSANSATPKMGDYLVAPRYMAWQYQQSSLQHTNYNNNGLTTDPYRNFNSDAWGRMGINTFVTGYAYENLHTGWDNAYSAWKDDLVWLPSITEMGVRAYEGDESEDGLWQTKFSQRANQGTNWSYLSWTRSAVGEVSSTSKSAVYMQDGQVGNNLRDCDKSVAYGSTFLVRPAIHLNLSKANGSASGVSFGIGSRGNSVTTESIDGANVKVATKSDNYNNTANTAATINVLDYSRLDFAAASGVDVSDVTNINDIKASGVFSAVKPATEDEKIYEIQVTPLKGYHWDDTTDTNEWKKPRRYRIKIQLADISVSWNNLSVTSGGSLLQVSSPAVVGGSTVESTIKVKYFIVTPNTTAQPPTGDDGWIENDSDHASDFIASQSGTYYVYYKITADYHNPTEVGCYEVNVGSDSVKVTVSNVSIGSATYSEGNALKLTEENQSWLKGQLQSRLTFTSISSGSQITGSELETLWGRLEIYPFTYNSNNIKVNYTPNSNGYYDVGTYLFGVRYKSDVSVADQTYTFTWEIQDGKEIHPTFTVNKKTVKVKVVGADGATLTHIYGETPVDMTYELVNEHFFDANGEDISALKLWDNFTIKDTDGDTIESTTPAGTHYMIGAAHDSNYDVQFENSPYEITKRPVTLKVADEEVEYGKSFDNYKFKLMSVIDGNIIDVDDLETLTANAVYTLKQNGIDTTFSDTLLRGDYELYAGVETDGKYVFETDNYKFEILKGKLTVTKANFDMSGITFTNASYVHDGNPHPAQISGTLPSTDITVSYRYVNMADGSESTDAPVEIGLYLVYASFTHTNENYNDISDKVAYIRIAATQEEANQPFPNLPTDEEIEAAAQLAKKKAEAKKSLDEEAKAKKDEIDADPNLTDNEKAAAKSEIDSELAAGNAAIDSATDANGINKAYNDGKKEIDDTADLAKKKGEAKKSLENAAKAKKDEIDANEELTDEEKEEAKAKVDAELAAGKDAIDGATDANGVQSAQSTSKANIENIKGIHKENSSFPWWIIIVVAGVLLLLAVLIIIIVKRRQVADGDDEYDDFYDDEYDFDEDIEEEYDDGEDFGEDF